MSIALQWLAAIAILSALTLGMIATVAVVLSLDIDGWRLEPGTFYLAFETEPTSAGRWYQLGLGWWVVSVAPIELTRGEPPSGADLDNCHCHDDACNLVVVTDESFGGSLEP